jgi:hypothetical protein
MSGSTVPVVMLVFCSVACFAGQPATAPTRAQRLALDYLERMANMPLGRQVAPAVQKPLWHIREELQRMPPDEAYTVLRDWTLPAEGRNAVRLAAAFGGDDILPEVFHPTREDQQDAPAGQPPRSDYGLIDNFTLLIDAARRAGTLDELAGRAKRAAEQGATNADALLTCVLIARKDFKAAAAKLIPLADAAYQHRQNPQGGDFGVRWSDIVVVSAAGRHIELADGADRYGYILLDHARSGNLMEFAPGLRIEWAKGQLARMGKKPVVTGDAGLKWWFPSTPPGSSDNQHPSARWISDGDYVAHLAGFEHGLLYFAYPLTGDFELSADCHHGPWAESDLGYGGIVVEAQIMQAKTLVWPLGQSEQLHRPDPVEYGDTFNHIDVNVANGSMRYLVNGHLVYEDTVSSPTAPWLYFYAQHPRHTAFKNVRLTGKPTVPREVTLTYGDRLEGWVSSFYGETQPPRRTLLEQRQANGSGAFPVQETSSAFDWESRDGVIYGRFDKSAPPDGAQSRLYYHRPLRDGDTLRYQFLYQTGSLHVHPGIGRLAFLLNPDGVQLHWMTNLDRNQELFDLGPRNFVEEPENRRGPTPLPLRPGQWNDMEIALRRDVATIKLNGVLVYERTLEPENDRRFSLFHYRDESGVQVRHAMLTGDWPKELSAEQFASPLALRPDAATPEALAESRLLIGDQLIVLDAYNVWKRAQAMKPADRYEYLARWVLPGDDHPTFRLRGDFAPIPAPVLKDNALKSSPSQRAATEGVSPDSTGGKYVAPAIELARTARESGRLEELANRLAASPAISAHELRGKLAMQAIVTAEQENDAAANELLRELFSHLMNMTLDEPDVRRYPEVTAAMAAIERPVLRRAGRDLLEIVVNQPFEQNYLALSSTRWERIVRHLRAVARWKSDDALAAVPFSSPPPLKQWTVVDNRRADGRGLGSTGSSWRYERGEVELYPQMASRFYNAHSSKLYFNVPLRGNFEVQFQRTTHGWREVCLGYNAVAINPLGLTGNRYARTGMGRRENSLGTPPIRDWGHWIDYRMEVRDGTLTAYANGQKFHTEPLSELADPWLVLGSSHPHYQGTIRDLRITGNPTVPDMLKLTEAPQLNAWRADYYNYDIPLDGHAIWQKSGEEIVGELDQSASGSMREHVLQYHRPMLEDGEIDYEFYYSPGKVEVHPALDRLVFLLEPDGVKLHVLTDAQFERNGLIPETKQPLPAAAVLANQLPLKQNDWNQLRVALTGDQVTLTLNGQPIARNTLDEANTRFFGLFRYIDATEARVRNVTYRGDWVQTVPPVEQQELAARPGVSPVSIDGKIQELRFKLSTDRAELERQGLELVGETDSLNFTRNGLRFSQSAAVVYRKPLMGDFEIIGKFKDLKLNRPGLDQTARFGLVVRMGTNDTPDLVMVERAHNGNGQQQIRAICHRTRPDGEIFGGDYYDWHNVSRMSAGEFRLVRRGSRVYHLVREEGAERFTVIESQPVNADPVDGIELGLYSDDAEAANSVVVEELTIRNAQ